MPRARKHLVCLSETPYYHITSRCVRRAFLCGVDEHSGKSYEHRRAWVEDRIRVLASIFRIDVCAYAVMSNHYHLVVRLQSGVGDTSSDAEILTRWTTLFYGPLLVQRFQKGESLTMAESDTLRSIVAVYRARLHSLSWFMKCLNEPVAKRANTEDGCTGHFWEARFNSQPLRSEKALFAAMAYVDLNPVRAKISKTPEQSGYTSIKARISGNYRMNTLAGAVQRMLGSNELNHFKLSIRPLLPFAVADTLASHTTARLPMSERDYVHLVDTTGRAVRSNKKGRIDQELAPILVRLGFSADQWIQAATAFRDHFRNGDLRLKTPA